ncbi:TIGR03564 family F420-dependent LLM class oxidoreductase [Tsukamurella soli]|uniref:TIGR03564 family F420-dependent LLM class oxidoreductase n=1 Tax=Tsukamurella soli TaxID=644556 RepID=A0ABP8JPX4_9ACTN
MSTEPVIGAALSFAGTGNAVDDVIERARVAAAAGLGAVWLGQRFDYDAIALAALIGREIPGVTVGSSAVPIFGRHPIIVAAQAQTAQAATHGRFQLGLALGAAELTEKAFGIEFRRPALRLQEFLIATRELFATGTVDFRGEELSAQAPLPTSLPGADPVPPILVAALSPRALAVSGRYADGILPNLAAPRVLEGHIVPAVTAAAEEAGRPAPRIVAAVTALVTDDPAAGRERLFAATGFYERVPSYRRVLELGGATRAGEIGLVGSAADVRAGLHEYLDAGATELILTQTGLLGREVERATWEVAATVGR